MNAVVDTLSRNPTRIDLLLRQAFLNKLAHLESAVLTISDALGEKVLGSEGPDGLRARIDVLDMSFYRQVALGGSIGAAESYMDQDWQADDLCRVIQILVRNRDLLDSTWKAVWQHWRISCSNYGISPIATLNKAAEKI